MRNVIADNIKHSKKGTTLVELVIAMTLTLLFAVVCVALINPIERTYQATEKVAHAQLLADTVVDSIRKECNDVMYDDPNAVWIAAGDFNDEAYTDDEVLFTSNTDLKSDSGFVLVIKKNNNYCEAIYSCFPISDQNIANVKNNPVQGDVAAHAVSSLDSLSNPENMQRGIVHFGYYQAKYSKEGMYPLYAYDYTNPITASTYEGYKVSLTFQNIGKKQYGGQDYPSYVECTVNILDGGEIVYSRTAAICFSANGSAQGNGSNSTIIDAPGKHDIRITVNWEDDHNSGNTRPTAGVKYLLCDKDNTVLATYELTDYASDQKVFRFDDIDTSNGVKIVQQPDQIPGYKSAYIGTTKDGFYISNEIEETTPKVKLIAGEKFRNSIGKDVTNVIFGANTPENLALVEGVTPVRVSIDRENKPTDDYLLYIVNKDGKKYAYILSTDGKFVANELCNNMFEGCTKIEAISGLDGLDTRYTTTMNKMFQNIGVEQDKPLAIDLSSFSFESCTTINKLFYVDKGTSTIETIIFPSDHKDMHNIERLDAVFSGCSSLKNLKYFNDINFSGVKSFNNIFAKCSAIEELDLSGWSCTSLDTLYGSSDKGAPNDSGLFSCSDKKYPGLSSVRVLKLNGLELPECESATNLLKGLNSLEELYLNDLDISKVDSLDGLFANNSKLEVLELNNCKTGNITSAKSLFEGCSNLSTVKVSGLIKEDCTDINSIFKNCKNLDVIYGLDTWDTSGVADMSYAFYNCHTDTDDDFELDVSGFDFDNVTDMSHMFGGSGVVKISFPSNGDDAYEYINAKEIEGLFQNCKGLTTIEGFDNVSFPEIEDASHLFGGCESLTSVDFNMELEKVKYIDYMFSNCTSLSEVNLAFDFPAVETASGLFDGCHNLTKATLDLDFDVVSSVNDLFDGCENLTEINLDLYAPQATSAAGLFSGCENLTTLTFSADLSSVENISYMFNDCQKLTTIDTGTLNFSNVKQANYLFSGCSSLESIDCDFNMPQVEELNYLFSGCSSLKEIDYKINMPNVKSINHVFDGCTGLKSMTLNWDCQQLTSANNIFNGCTGLETVDLKFKFPKVSDIVGLFDGCTSLREVDLELESNAITNVTGLFKDHTSLKTANVKLNIPNVKYLDDLFNGCSDLTSIKMDFDYENALSANNLFMNCTNLKTVDVNFDMPECKSINNLFNGCSSLSTLAFELDCEKATTATGMFTNCTNLSTLTVRLNLPSATKTSEMFKGCSGLTTLTAELDFPSITSMNNFFNGLSSLKTVDLSNSDFSGLKSSYSMFNSCTELTDITMDGVNLSGCTSTGTTFNACNKILNISMQNADVRKTTSISFLAKDTATHVNVSGSNFSGVTSLSGVWGWGNNRNIVEFIAVGTDFSGCKEAKSMFSSKNPDLNYVDFSNANLNECTTVEKMFSGCSGLTKAYFVGTSMNKCTSYNYMFNNCTKLTDIKFGVAMSTEDVSATCDYMFQHCDAATSFDFTGWDTSKVSSMQYMFAECYAIGTIDLSMCSTVNVTNMSYMFKNCHALSSVNFNGCNTSNVNNMKGMFKGCSILCFDSKSWEAWSTANVTDMSEMFNDCCYDYLKTDDPALRAANFYIDISNFDFSSVRTMENMFSCGANKNEDFKYDILDTVILPDGTNDNGNAANVTNTMYMFMRRTNMSEIRNLEHFKTSQNLVTARSMFSRVGCTELDISGLDFSNLQTGDNGSAWMFDNCPNLTTIYVLPGTDYSNAGFTGKQMFYNTYETKKITGGNGFTYDASIYKKNNNIDKVYARVDTEDTPGYFTAKSV